MIRLALIGTGTMGTNYLKYIAEGSVPSVTAAAAVSRRPEKQQEIRELFHDSIAVFESEEELYAHPECFDAVLVATPHSLHAEMGMRALRAGTHLMLDKPAGVCTAECRPLADLADDAGLKFSVMFHQRMFPKFRRVKELLEHREIGDITRVLMKNSRYFRTEHYHRSSPWRSSWNGESGGLMINQAQHLIDMWQWLFGMPETLYADICFGKYNDFSVDDEVTIVMDYPDRKTGVFLASTGEGTGSDLLEITGSLGTIVLEDQTLTITRYDQDLNDYRKNAECNSRERLRETVVTEQLEENTKTHPLLLENFARAVEGKEPLVVEGRNAVNALELTNAAYLSAWNHEVIGFPIDEQRYVKELLEHQNAEREAGKYPR